MNIFRISVTDFVPSRGGYQMYFCEAMSIQPEDAVEVEMFNTGNSQVETHLMYFRDYWSDEPVNKALIDVDRVFYRMERETDMLVFLESLVDALK